MARPGTVADESGYKSDTASYPEALDGKRRGSKVAFCELPPWPVFLNDSTASAEDACRRQLAKFRHFSLTPGPKDPDLDRAENEKIDALPSRTTKRALDR
jgi:hypothetical protein